MSVEFEYSANLFPPEEFGKKLRTLGITTLLTDMDDALLATRKVFLKHMQSFAKFIADISEMDIVQEDVFVFMSSSIEELRGRFMVNPALMAVTADRTVSKFGLEITDGRILSAHEHLMAIYHSPEPEMFPRVAEALAYFGKAQIRRVVVTHGGEEYSQKKTGFSGLTKYIDTMYALDDRKPKDAEAWNTVLNKEEIQPNNIIGVGDSWLSDIHPLIRLGVPENQLFRIKSIYPHANIGKIKGICELESFAQSPFAINERLLAG